MDITRDKISRQSKPIQSNTVCTVIYRRRSSVHPRRPGRFLCADFSKPPNQHGVPYRVVNFLISLGVWCGGACAGQCGNEEFEKALAEIQPVLNGLKCSSAPFLRHLDPRPSDRVHYHLGRQDVVQAKAFGRQPQRAMR